MSLFEKIKDRKQNLTEQSRGSGFSNRNRKDITKILSKIGEDPKGTANKVLQSSSKSVTAPKPDEVASAKALLRNKKKQQNQQIAKNRAEGDKLLQDINKRKSADLTRADAINRAMGTSGSTEGAAGASGTKTVKQSEVSKKAQEFTKKINKKNKNRTFFDPEKAKEARKNLIAKRKEYGIDRKGNIPGSGVERYARKTKQLSSGSNLPVKITKADKDLAKTRLTNKYGRRLGRTRNKNMDTFAQVKAKIDAKNPTYKSPLTGGQLPNIGSPESQVKRLDPNLYKDAKKLKGIKSKYYQGTVSPDGTIKPKTVLKRVKPTATNPSGFEPVDTETKKGRRIFKKKYVSTANLLDPTPKPKSSTTKPNLFSRIKNFVKGEPKIPSDYNLVRGTKDQPLSVTRKVYKGKLGAVRKFVDKLPRKYKLAGTALIATAAAVPSIKKAFAPKPEKKSYTVANKTLKLDTGKKNT